MKPTYCDAPDAPPPTGGYSQAAVVEGARRTVHISGQIPADAEGRTPAGFDAQCRLVWRNVERQLLACGMNFDNLVKVTTYLSDRCWGEVNGAVRREFLGARRPALTVVVAGLFDDRWLLEIEAVAAD